LKLNSLKVHRDMATYARNSFFLLLALLAAGAAGCGPSELPKPRLHRVRGTLTIRGEPARYVTITFEPLSGSHGFIAEGQTSHDGSFELRSFSNEGEPDGAAAGEYEVVLEGAGGAPPDAPEGIVGTKFEGEFRTGIIVLVEEKDNDIAIDVP
jgi:hypothetical protein